MVKAAHPRRGAPLFALLDGRSDDANMAGAPAVAVTQPAEAVQVVDDQAAGLKAEDPFPLHPVQHAVDAFPGGADEVGQVLVGQFHGDQDARFCFLATGVAEPDQGGSERSGFAVGQKIADFGLQNPLVD